MKSIIFSLFILATGSTAFAQNGNDYRNNRNNNNNTYQAPQRVQQGWQRDHPNYADPNWQKGTKHWDARYQDQATNRTVDAYYDKRGRVIDTHRQWDRKDLPNDFDRRIRDRYHTTEYRVTRIDRPRDPSLFQILLNIGGGSRTIYVDEQGNEVRYRDRH